MQGVKQSVTWILLYKLGVAFLSSEMFTVYIWYNYLLQIIIMHY